MKTSLQWRLGLTAVWLLVAARAVAQSNDSGLPALKQLSLEQLALTEISSVTKEPVPAFQTPAAVSVMTNDEIRRSGARNIPDLLRLIPGVEVGMIDSSEWAVGVRGFQGRLSRSVLVLIDGRSVYTPLFAGVYWEMQDVMIEDIDRIEVVRGPGGTIWGSNAVNGVINIITKDSRETRGALVSAGGGNWEQGFLNLRYGGGSDALSYRVWGKAFHRDSQHHSDGRNFDDFRRGQAGFRMDWQASDRDALTIQGDAYAGEAGQLLRLNFYSPPSNPVVQADKRFNGQNIMTSWRRVVSPSSDVHLQTYYDRSQREELTYEEVRHTVDVDFTHHLEKGRHGVTWGLGARFSPSTFVPRVPTVDFIPHKQTYNIYSAFLQDEWSLVRDRLRLTLGTKFEHTTYSGFDYQPTARLAWTPNAEHTFWGTVTRAVRTPSRIEDGFRFTALLAPTTPPLYVRLIGDGQFNSEELTGYEVGYRNYVSSRGFFSVSLFHNRYDDLLSVESRPVEIEAEPDPVHQVLPLDLRNGIVAQSNGGEVSSLWDVQDWMRLRASYSYVRMDARRVPGSNDASTVRQLEGDSPRHKVVLQGAITLPKEFELNLAFRYFSAIPNQAVGAYSTGDLRIGRRLGEHFEVEVVGRNLLQPFHVEYGGLPGPKVGIRRSGFVALTWTR